MDQTEQSTQEVDELPAAFVADGAPPAAAPAAYQGVWPPRPEDGFAQPVIIPFTFLYRKLKGNLSDVRSGVFQLDGGYFTIDGKAMPRNEIATPVMIFTLMLGAGVIISYLLLRYVFLVAAHIQIPWSDVTEIVVVPNKRWVAIAFRAPNYKGRIKPFTLAATLRPGDFESFVGWTNAFAPGKLREGRIGDATSIVVWIFVGLLAALLLIGIIAAIATGGGSR